MSRRTASGWLVNQLDRGNNIALRLAMLDCENVHELRTVGERHEHFEDTPPGDRSSAAKADGASRVAKTPR